MTINNKWYSEPEMQALVTRLTQERDAYKAELIDVLRQASTCVADDDTPCSECPYFYMKEYEHGCPVRLRPDAAEQRLEELTGVNVSG